MDACFPFFSLRSRFSSLHPSAALWGTAQPPLVSSALSVCAAAHPRLLPSPSPQDCPSSPLSSRCAVPPLLRPAPARHVGLRVPLQVHYHRRLWCAVGERREREKRSGRCRRKKDREGFFFVFLSLALLTVFFPVPAVGKSCLLLQFTDKRFQPVHDLTIGTPARVGSGGILREKGGGKERVREREKKGCKKFLLRFFSSIFPLCVCLCVWRDASEHTHTKHTYTHTHTQNTCRCFAGLASPCVICSTPSTPRFRLSCSRPLSFSPTGSFPLPTLTQRRGVWSAHDQHRQQTDQAANMGHGALLGCHVPPS